MNNKKEIIGGRKPLKRLGGVRKGDFLNGRVESKNARKIEGFVTSAEKWSKNSVRRIAKNAERSGDKP